jgi:hypothetical protein
MCIWQRLGMMYGIHPERQRNYTRTSGRGARGARGARGSRSFVKVCVQSLYLSIGERWCIGVGLCWHDSRYWRDVVGKQPMKGTPASTFEWYPRLARMGAVEPWASAATVPYKVSLVLELQGCGLSRRGSIASFPHATFRFAVRQVLGGCNLHTCLSTPPAHVF